MNVRVGILCYTMVVNARDPRRGPAYPFWERVQAELAHQMSLNELVRRSGVTATVIDSMRTSPPRNRSTREKNVLAVATVLGIDPDEARQLAGLIPGESKVDVRDAIYRSGDYNDDEKKAIIGLLDVLDASKRSSRRVEDSA